MQNCGRATSFISSIAGRVRSTLKRGKQQHTILLLTMHRLGMRPLMERILSRKEILKA